MRIRAEILDVSMDMLLRSASQPELGGHQAIHNRVYILGNSNLLTALIAVTKSSEI